MKENIIRLLAKFLLHYGFIYNQKSNAFKKIEEERICTIELNFVGERYIYLYYGIRFNSVEKIIDNYYHRKPNPENLTIFIDTGDLLVDPKLYRFSIQNQSETESSTIQLIALIEKFAFDYFERYATIEDLHKLLNDLPYVASKIRNNFYHNETMSGFFRGIVVAKLLDIRIDDLVDFHNKYLKNNYFREENIAHYLRFVEYCKKTFI